MRLKNTIRCLTGQTKRLGCLVAIFSLGASLSVSAQDLAEVARQNRGRQAARPLHVYTNDDLKRDQILTPQDRQRAEAGKPAAPAAGQSYVAGAATASAAGASTASAVWASTASAAGTSATGVAAGTTAATVGPTATAAAPILAGAPGSQSNAEESLGDVARRFLARKAEEDRARKERQIQVTRQKPLELLPLELATPELMRQPSLAYPFFPAPNVKPPAEPPAGTPRKVLRSGSQGALAPEVLAQPADSLDMRWPTGNLAAPPAAPWIAPLPAPSVSSSRPRRDVPPAPFFPTTRSLVPLSMSDIVDVPIAPIVEGGDATDRSESDQKVSGSGEGTPRRILVEPGDTLWRIAGKYLGHGQNWPQLVKANPQVSDPTRLAAGTWILLPKRGAELAAHIRIQAQRGDTLSIIARDDLGGVAAWRCLAHANPQIKNPNLIFAGQMLNIPESCSSNRPTMVSSTR